MVYVPGAPEESRAGAYTLDNELSINRLNTEVFISQDPVDIRLLRPATERTATGATRRGVVRVLEEQRFKLIMISPAGGSIDQRTDDGTVTRVDYVLLGRWDADVQPGDYWDDEAGRRWEVTSIIPTNNYETRANVNARGSGLEGG